MCLRLHLRLHLCPRGAARLLCMGLFISLIAGLLTACGGGDYSAGTPPEAPDTGPLAGPAVRVEVEPAALLLSSSGQQQRLLTRAFDKDGRVVKTAVTWQASRPTEVDVAADGTVRAAVALGSGQVVAVVDGVRSAPVLVAVAQPAAGVLLVNDAQIVSAPVAVDPAAEPSIDNAYEVVLSGVSPPAVGSLLLGREGQAIGGEVLASTPVANGVRVRLQVVSLERLMQTAQIQEDIDLKGLPLQVPADIAALYDVKIENDEYLFTPRPGVSASGGVPTDRRQALAVKKFKLGPFSCDVVSSELPISLSQPAQFSLKFSPSYVVDYQRGSGLKRLLFRAEASFKIKAGLQLNASALVNMTCDSTLVERLVPLPGFAGLLLGGQLQAGVGFETEGTVTIPLLGAELSAEIKGKMEAGIDCSSGSCRMVSEWKPEATNTLRFFTPEQAPANARSEFFLFSYGFAKMRVGLTLVSEARIDAVSVRGGLKFETSLAPAATQLTPVASGQPDYRSDYKLQALAEVSAGSFNKGDTAFRALLQKLGVFKVTLLKMQLALPLGVSPKGSANFTGADVGRDGEAVDGKTVDFTVNIDPATANFPLLGYNVKRVRIFLVQDGLLPREVASVDANAEQKQTEFKLSWVASGTAGATGRGFAALVDTALPLPFSLELATAQRLPGVMQGRVTMTENLFSPFPESRTDIQTTLLGNDQTNVVDAFVEHDGFTQLRVLRKNASREFRLKRNFRTSFRSGGCTAIRIEESISSGGGSTGSVFGRDKVDVELDFPNMKWKVSGMTVVLPQSNSGVEVRRFVNVRGCEDIGLVGTSTDVSSFNPEAEHHTFFTDHITRQSLSGPITLGPDGRRMIQYTGQPVNIVAESPDGTSFRKVALTLDLKEGPAISASTDLAIALVATPTVKPQGRLTYSVNLENLGAGPATELRADFSLPPGWTVLSMVGWSACSSTQGSVVCRLDRMEAAERRAFLVEVQAPDALGLYTVSARVSAAEFDTDFSNNRTESTSTVVE